MVAPEPYLSACMEVLYRTAITCRMWGWSNNAPSEHLADLMDAIHNIPHLVQNWEGCDVKLLREGFLQPYQEKWRSSGGLPLCQIFDDVVANRTNNN